MLIHDARCKIVDARSMWFLTSNQPCTANKLPYTAHKLSAENLKLRQKLEEAADQSDNYARLYNKALAEFESYKRRIDFIHCQ